MGVIKPHIIVAKNEIEGKLELSDDLCANIVGFFGQPVDNFLIRLVETGFRNILVKHALVNHYAFRVLGKIMAVKGSVSRTCFSGLGLTRFVAERALECLKTVDAEEGETGEKRESLYELLGKVFLSDQIDDFIVNSHWMLNHMFAEIESETTPTKVRSPE